MSEKRKTMEELRSEKERAEARFCRAAQAEPLGKQAALV